MVLRYPLDYLRAFRLPALGFGVWPGLGCSSLALAWPLGRHLLLAPRGNALREALGAAPREGLVHVRGRAAALLPEALRRVVEDGRAEAAGAQLAGA